MNTDGEIQWKKTFGGTGNEKIIKSFSLGSIGYYFVGNSQNFTGTGYWEHTAYINSFTTSAYFIKTDIAGNCCK